MVMQEILLYKGTIFFIFLIHPKLFSYLMEKKIKAALTTLNNDLGDDDVIIITKNKTLYESNNYEYDDTWKINNDIDVLREAGLQKIFDQEDSESSTTTKTTTKKKRTPNA